MEIIVDVYELEKSFERKYSKKRSNQAITKMLNNGSYIRPEKEDEIIEYMLSNCDVDYPHLEKLFNVSIPKLQRLRTKYKFPTIKKKDVMSFQNVLKLEGKRKCPRCKTIKELKHWYKNNLSRCSVCEKNAGPEKLRRKQFRDTSSLELFLKNKLAESKRRKLENTLTLHDLVDKYNNQSGKCYYSGREMEIALRTNSMNSISIDRIDSNQGYTKENVVLCCSIVNTMKLNHDILTFIDTCSDIVKHQTQSQQEPP